MEPKHILVVDDDPVDLELLSEILIGAGYRVSTAKSSIEALKLAKRGSVDLALVDLLMPGIDGYSLIGMLTRDRMFKAPVLVISGRVEEKDAKRALDTGAVGFVAKPVDGKDLVARVEELINRDNIQ
ncbi:MAG: response regulator [candidate division WOR-3 bacterium]|nr:MAG: response regulator [candidate division WOR-3 bacterium]